MQPAPEPGQIDAIRRFNRFYTGAVGALDRCFLDTALGLAEARLLFEIARMQPVPARALGEAIGMDAGQLSRLLSGFERAGWLVRPRNARDSRLRPVSLTPEGALLAGELDRRQQEATAGLVEDLSPAARAGLVSGLSRARLLLAPGGPATLVLRPHCAGDLARLAARQAVLYQEEQGWGTALEQLVMESALAFLRRNDPARERCWIAELDGTMAGSVLLTDEGEGVGRLRLLYVEPFARGRGVGERLVSACRDVARAAGYAELVLWTHTVLEPARRLYARQGFKMVRQAVHHAFGVPVQGEDWTCRLRS